MLPPRFAAVVVALLRLSAPAAAAPAPDLVRRSTVLADGSSYQSGSISSTFRWQASGVLTEGGCPSDVGIEVRPRRSQPDLPVLPRTSLTRFWFSKDCFAMNLAASGELESGGDTARRTRRRRTPLTLTFDERAAHDDGDLEAYALAWPSAEETSPAAAEGSVERRQVVMDCSPSGGGGGGGSGSGGGGTAPTPRQVSSSSLLSLGLQRCLPIGLVVSQRIELFSWPGAEAATTWTYTWKSHTVNTSTSAHFFHVWQILRRDACGGPVVTLDLLNDKATITDTVRNCTDCASAPVASFFDRTVHHTLQITFGINGRLSYAAYDAASPLVPLLQYQAEGDMGAKASLKFGSYRAVAAGMEPVTTFAGDRAFPFVLVRSTGR
ncbi:hypothetical protein JCM1841_003321 [Sporobolomyces salmonicolor]